MLIKPVWVDANNTSTGRSVGREWAWVAAPWRFNFQQLAKQRDKSFLICYIITERLCDEFVYDVVIENRTRNQAIIRKSKRRL